jgi:hypothetical protein
VDKMSEKNDMQNLIHQNLLNAALMRGETVEAYKMVHKLETQVAQLQKSLDEVLNLLKRQHISENTV